MKKTFFPLIATSIMLGSVALSTNSMEAKHLQKLNKYLKAEIFQYLSIEDLLALSRTNKVFRQIAIDEIIKKKPSAERIFDAKKDFKSYFSAHSLNYEKTNVQRKMNSFVTLAKDKNYFASLKITNCREGNIENVFVLLMPYKNYISSLDIGDTTAKQSTRSGWTFCNEPLNIGIKKLHEFLKENNTLTSLGLGSKQLSDNNVIELTQAINLNKKLKHLDLSSSSICKYKLNRMKQTLQNGPITHLYLAHNYMKAKGVKTILEISENSPLTYLDLSQNFDLNGENVETIKELLKKVKLTGLNLSFNHINSVNAITLMQALQKNSHLTDLDLSANPIFWNKNLSKDIITHLKETHILHLNLAKTDISETGEEILSLFQDSRIQELDLRENYICVESLKNISNSITNSDIKVIRFCLSKRGKKNIDEANEDSYEKQLDNLKLTMEAWKRKEGKLFDLFMEEQNFFTTDNKMITTEFLNDKIENYIPTKNEESFLQRLDNSWYAFLKKQDLQQTENPFNPLDFYHTQNSLVYLFKKQGIKVDFTEGFY